MSVRLQLLNGGEVVAEHLVVEPIWHYKLADDPNRPARFDAIHLAVPPTADPGLADVYRDALAALVPSIGSIWLWMPQRLDISQHMKVQSVRWNGEEWWVTATDETGKPSSNELGRWMEACVFVGPGPLIEENDDDVSMGPKPVDFTTMRRLVGSSSGWAQQSLFEAVIDRLEEHERRLNLLRLRPVESVIAPWVVRDEETGEPVTLAPEEQLRQMEVEMADMRRALTEAYGYRQEAERAKATTADAEARYQTIEGALGIAMGALEDMTDNDMRADAAIAKVRELLGDDEV